MTRMTPLHLSRPKVRGSARVRRFTSPRTSFVRASMSLPAWRWSLSIMNHLSAEPLPAVDVVETRLAATAWDDRPATMVYCGTLYVLIAFEFRFLDLQIWGLPESIFPPAT